MVLFLTCTSLQTESYCVSHLVSYFVSHLSSYLNIQHGQSLSLNHHHDHDKDDQKEGWLTWFHISHLGRFYTRCHTLACTPVPHQDCHLLDKDDQDGDVCLDHQHYQWSGLLLESHLNDDETYDDNDMKIWSRRWWQLTCSFTVSYFVSHFSSYLVEHCSSNSVRHSFSYLASISNGFHTFYLNTNFFFINQSAVWFDLLGFTLVFVDSLTFGIRNCFTLLLVRLQQNISNASNLPKNI